MTMETKTKSTWQVLSKINCNEKVEKKNGLTYLSWAWAWGIVKENFPDANYEIVMFDNKPYLYDFDLGYLVMTKVTIQGETIPMQLPIMDNTNKAMKSVKYQYETKYGTKTVDAATMFDINTAIMRCLTKNLAMFGLGHYIYAGEDLPSDIKSEQEKEDEINDVITKAKTILDVCKTNEDVDTVVKEYMKRIKSDSNFKKAFAPIVAETRERVKKNENSSPN